jgi:hypothetical protein
MPRFGPIRSRILLAKEPDVHRHVAQRGGDVVGRAIVDNDDLEGRVGLERHGTYGIGDERGAIVNRNDDADELPRAGVRHRRRVRASPQHGHRVP